jgi:dephospho-CoA kinase
MLRIALTGGIGSGKTSVSDLFTKLGVPVIDTDIIARQLTDTDKNVLAEITDAFGKDVLNLDGKLNRKKLAQIVFNIKESKQQLENILHPRIQTEVIKQLQDLASIKNPPVYALIVIPLFFETDFDYHADRILAVIAEEKTRIERIRQRDKRGPNEIHSIIANQINDVTRTQKSDDIIKNNSNIKDLESQVNDLHNRYTHLIQEN